MSPAATPAAPISLKDLTIENITSNVHAIKSTCPDPRLKFLLERVVVHLHDLARETRLSAAKWMKALLFLTEVGQISSDVRQEFILLSDILGLSLLVNSIDHPKPKGGTDGTVLSPLHTHDAVHSHNGDSISADPSGKPLLVLCTVKKISIATRSLAPKSTSGKRPPKAFMMLQYSARSGPDGRAILTSDDSGAFWFKAVLPVPYPIPHDGPVGKLLKQLGRHPCRPSHTHLMFKKDGYDPLITASYLKDDPYESTDAVFGVKDSLIVKVQTVEDNNQAKQFGVEVGTALIKYDFVLVTETAVAYLRQEESERALTSQGQSFRFIDGLPASDVG